MIPARLLPMLGDDFLGLAGIGEAVVSNIIPGLQFSHGSDRLDFTAPRRIHDLTGEPSTLDFTAENN